MLTFYDKNQLYKSRNVISDCTFGCFSIQAIDTLPKKTCSTLNQNYQCRKVIILVQVGSRYLLHIFNKEFKGTTFRVQKPLCSLLKFVFSLSRKYYIYLGLNKVSKNSNIVCCCKYSILCSCGTCSTIYIIIMYVPVYVAVKIPSV